MTTVLAQKGQVVIPKSIREELELDTGDDFEVFVQDGEIVLRPLQRRRNEGLAKLLLNPPGCWTCPIVRLSRCPLLSNFSNELPRRHERVQ